MSDTPRMGQWKIFAFSPQEGLFMFEVSCVLDGRKLCVSVNGFTLEELPPDPTPMHVLRAAMDKVNRGIQEVQDHLNEPVNEEDLIWKLP